MQFKKMAECRLLNIEKCYFGLNKYQIMIKNYLIILFVAVNVFAASSLEAQNALSFDGTNDYI